MLTSIASGLGIGSGIDTRALVADLAANAREGRQLRLQSRELANTARISALGALKEGIATLAANFDESRAGVDTAGLRKLATSFIAGFNVLRGEVADATRPGIAGAAGGALIADPAARALSLDLSRLPQANLASAGTYRTLSDIGIGVTRSGTLQLDATRFEAALAAQPTEVAALLTGDSGLSGALKAISDRITARDGVFAQSTARYERVSRSLDRERTALEDANARLVERLTKSFAGMDRQVAQLKAVQSYVEQQVAAWNSQK